MKSLHLINQQLEQLPAEQRQAIVTLIDFKTDGDMEKVLQELSLMRSELNTKIDKFETKLEAIDNKFEAKLTAMNDKFETRFTVLMWMVGALIVLMVGLFTK